ncbi:hypothetical protein SAMN05216184_11276 [Georgenia satyanarayanai]|uniref:Uncharacterized protein n=2 Tax=Georgenia satyanarayanai TaxID=860221 RepID=A0A2Y9ARX9_9MICO|nr:hypothetical protein A8987_11276 [Georgenia satyanarayanai]SSA45217.1 hypothetical protein SAMN05216184_11276 [Georgenia satyanarayanai]
MATPPRLGPLRLRAELTFAAFTPAFALLAVRTYGTWWLWPFVVLAAVGVVLLAVLTLHVRSGNAEPFHFDDVEDRGEDVLGHIGAYLLPVVLDPSAGSREVVITVSALGLIVLIHIATGRVHVNPLVYLAGRRIHTGLRNGSAYYVISRTDPATWAQTRPRFVSVAPSLLVEKKEKA